MPNTIETLLTRNLLEVFVVPEASRTRTRLGWDLDERADNPHRRKDHLVRNTPTRRKATSEYNSRAISNGFALFQASDNSAR